MRHRASRIVAVAVAGFALALALSGADTPARSGSNAAWESMKTLQGEWDGLYAGKMKVSAIYRLVSNGTALMETLVSPDHTDMVTMYHVDGARIGMTHFCSENNQPRLKSVGSNPKRIEFTYVDATNLSSPDAKRMTGLVTTLSDADHFTQEWTESDKGKEQKALFEFTRRK
ncbi:MAG: hypothetical protein ABI592_11275 [Acidobacteriota bacterium]